MKILLFGRVGWFLFLLALPVTLNSTMLPPNSTMPPPQAKAEWTGITKIVATGDIHGAYDEFVALLQELRLIDQKLNWIGDKTHFVQTGDSIDRGVQDRKVSDLLMSLEKQAEKAGGRVHALLGNHEVMNIIGDLRYVTPESYAAYGNEKSEELREKTYARYVKFRAARASRNIPSQGFKPDQKFKDNWLAKHPPGYLEHRKAFSESGVYGRWLSSHNAVLKLNDTVFLHGGINETISRMGLREINERIRREIKTFYELRVVLLRNEVIEDYLDFEESFQQIAAEMKYLQAHGGSDDPQLVNALGQFLALETWLITNPAGPLWYRGYAQEPEETFKPILERIKTNLGVAQLVVGHTPSLAGITSRFSSNVFLIDTGMLRSYYKGRCAALIIEDGKFSPFYPQSGPCA